MTYKLEFELQGLPKTTNSGGRAHWAVKVKEARLLKLAVGIATLGARPLKPLSKARLVLTRYSSSEPDADGLVSSFKHILDGLVEAGVLENDRRANIGMPDYRWEKCKPKQGRVRVEVEEVNEINKHEQEAPRGEVLNGN